MKYIQAHESNAILVKEAGELIFVERSWGWIDQREREKERERERDVSKFEESRCARLVDGRSRGARSGHLAIGIGYSWRQRWLGGSKERELPYRGVKRTATTPRLIFVSSCLAWPRLGSDQIAHPCTSPRLASHLLASTRTLAPRPLGPATLILLRTRARDLHRVFSAILKTENVCFFVELPGCRPARAARRPAASLGPSRVFSRVALAKIARHKGEAYTQLWPIRINYHISLCVGRFSRARSIYGEIWRKGEGTIDSGEEENR